MNEYIDETALKGLYRRGSTDESNRTPLRVTITPETVSMLKNTVSFGKGLYGSSFIELAIRLLVVCLASPEDVDLVASELKRVNRSGLLTINLRRILKYLES